MTLLEQWEQRRQEIQEALANGQIDADVAARELERLNYRINRRPSILKRRKDRNTYRISQALHHRTQRLSDQSDGVTSDEP